MTLEGAFSLKAVALLNEAIGGGAEEGEEAEVAEDLANARSFDSRCSLRTTILIG
jgi:hypothetical protein